MPMRMRMKSSVLMMFKMDLIPLWPPAEPLVRILVVPKSRLMSS